MLERVWTGAELVWSCCVACELTEIPKLRMQNFIEHKIHGFDFMHLLLACGLRDVAERRRQTIDGIYGVLLILC